MRDKKKILVIEDDSDIKELIQYNLEAHGYQTQGVEDGEKGLGLAQRETFDLCILDIMLPGIDGLTVLRELRSHSQTKSMRVIMLTAKGEESDVVIGLELGADDYMVKPFSPKELVARSKAVLRRNVGEETVAPDIIEVGPIKIDTERHEILVNNQRVAFTLAEFNVLKLLTSRPGRVFTRDQILDFVAGDDTFLGDRNVDVHVRSIRKKLGTEKEFISTIRGVGYKCQE